MKTLLALIVTATFAGSAFAGPIMSKNPKAPVMPPPPPAGCACFAPGFAVDVFGAAILPDNGDDELGGGVGFNYFFNEWVGVDFNYAIYATQSEHHEFDGALVLRAPIKSLCLAPYALVGGGFSTNSDNAGNFMVGGGIDFRFEAWGCKGLFAEGAYHFAEDDADGDYTTVRLGLRFPF